MEEGRAEGHELGDHGALVAHQRYTSDLSKISPVDASASLTILLKLGL